MKKKTQKKRTCSDCIHEYACNAWNIGNIHDADASACVNYETLKEYIKALMDKGLTRFIDGLAAM